jgi:hypothetical protein
MSKSFQDKELEILRNAVDKNQKKIRKKIVSNPDIKKIIDIVEKFLIKNKRICYGGTAINNILPIEDQFYDREVDIPDYDFFSDQALKDSKNLANIYLEQGFEEVTASAGMHPGTFKVFVNFIPVADITQLVPELFENLQRDALIINQIYYAPPNFLRMLAYLELSRPLGDTSRWEKVLKRINLLNKNYPLKGLDCENINIQRLYNADHEIDEEERLIFNIAKKSLIDQGCVFFGALASKMILKYLPRYRYEKIPNVPDFDVLSINPNETASFLKERLEDAGIKKIKIIKREEAGEIIGEHYEVVVGKETIVFIFKPLGCLSYNVVKSNGRKIRIATIDTLLNLYLGFLYTDRPYFDDKRILCISEYMFKVQQQNRLKQRGLLQRFNIDCYGAQKTVSDLRSDKSKKFNELKNKRGSPEWEHYFLRYNPYRNKNTRKKKKKPKRKNTRRKRKNMFGI